MLRRLLRRHSVAAQLALNLIVAFCFGIYINLLTGRMDAGLPAALRALGGANLWAIAGIAAAVVQVFLVSLQEQSREDREEDNETRVIASMIEAAARALIYPRSPESVFVRAFCHIADDAKKELRPLCMWSPHYVPDSDLCIPCDGEGADAFTVVQAYKSRHIVVNRITDQTRAKYPEPLRAMISTDLQCVLAAPIRDFNDSGGPVLGTIAFDSTSSLEDMAFDKADAKDIAKLFAQGVFLLLREGR